VNDGAVASAVVRAHMQLVGVLIEMEQQDSNPIRVAQEQVAEVERRRANPKRKLVTLEQVRRQLSFRRA
jgi:hypothetical protein